MKLQKYFCLLLLIFVLGCEKDDKNPVDEDQQQNEIVTIANRIEFSGINQIPNNLRVVSLEGSVEVDPNGEIPSTNIGEGIEFLKDDNGNLIFLKRNLPGEDNLKINAESTVLFMATSNSTYYEATTSQRTNIINEIKSTELFDEAVNILKNQTNINLYVQSFIDAVSGIVSFICQTPDIEQNSLQLGNVIYDSNTTSVTITNPTKNHIGLGVYINNLQQGIQVIDANESIQYDIEDANVEYRFKLMSGENVATSIFSDNELEEIEAFDDDIRLFLLESFFTLAGNAISVDCFNDVVELVFENVDFALLFEDSDSTFDAVIDALKLFFQNYSGVLEVANSCSPLNLESTIEILDDIGQVFEILGYRDYFCGIINKINDYERYDNLYEICLESNGTGVEPCGQDITEPAHIPNPTDGQIDIPLSGQLTFESGENTPTDATFKVYFDTNLNPTTEIDLGDQTSYSYSNLQVNTIYYWYVETLNNTGDVLATSPVWSFTTLSASNTIPTVSTNSITNITETSASSGGNITNDGGNNVTARGICWSTNQNPTTSNNSTNNGTGTGIFTSSLVNLNPSTTYYVRAYATNSEGTSYGEEIEFITESSGGGTNPIDVTNPITGKIWMDRNLGASQVATSPTDADAYGDLYQWGRATDGHESRTSGTTTTLSSTDQPGHGDFILAPSSPNDWRNPQNDNLWQGVSGINNPCPSGYRLPTAAELDAERTSWSSDNPAGAFASPLKLPAAGYRAFNFDDIISTGSQGWYWSSSLSNSASRVFSLGFYFDSAMYVTERAYGFSVRCLKD